MQIAIAGSQAALARLAAEGADADRIADAAVSTWREMDAALSPVIGQRGVAALFNRSLHLKRADHPWLAAAQADAQGSSGFAALQTALSQQTTTKAMAANGELLHAFCDLLGTLVGSSLTERLLKPVWTKAPTGKPAQDSP